MYMRRKVCHSDTIALVVVPGSVVLTAPSTFTNICCSVDTDALLKGCIYEIAQCIQDKRVVTS